MARKTRKIHVACTVDKRGKKRCTTYCPLEVKWNQMGVPTSVKGGIFRMVKQPVGALDKRGDKITKYTPDWARFRYELLKPCGRMEGARSGGHELEGRVRLRGKTYSAFTSGEGAGMIIVRSRKPAWAKGPRGRRQW